MRGKRLEVANQKAEKAFYKYHIQWNQNYWQERFSGVTYPPLGVYRKTKVFCSNPYCCGNGRHQKHTHNVTMQELKSEVYEKHWEEEHENLAAYPSGKGTVCKTEILSAASNSKVKYESE